MNKLKQIDRLIINSPYKEPSSYWSYDRKSRTFEQKQGRRSAGYVIATPGSKSFDDPGVFRELELVNKIRERVKTWRENNYPGITAITRRLLEHWRDEKERKDINFFFCQLEAIETIIWLNESPIEDRIGIEIPSDGGKFQRLCSKMATGTGKTVVMALLIAWQILNRVTYPKDNRFSSNIFIVTPGLTVKSRLQVLKPEAEQNYYDEFNIIPTALYEKLREGKVMIENWHSLSWETEEDIKKKKTVDKRGAKSDKAYTKEILKDMAQSKNIIVINDEAHHAWRIQPELKMKREFKDQINEATVWISGLDRIHKTVGILNCYDFSATPFAPSGKKSNEEALFEWIISDFGLNDAIESGLVKTPRIVVRDDGKYSPDYKSRLYHIYMDDEVKDDINRKGAKDTDPLPDLVQNAYYLLGTDWNEAYKLWKNAGKKTPPVMITVANTTNTASRIYNAFTHGDVNIPELTDKEYTLQIDSQVLDKAEAQTETLKVDTTNSLTKKEQAELLRLTVDTVGRMNEPGEQIRHVISVGMLSEGWDAKTVTHIMGLRAFSSQLLCEQVVGRGLRRTSYEIDQDTGLYKPEYVNIFGVPFTFLPHEGGDEGTPEPPKPQTQIEPDSAKTQFEITWPNILRIDRVYNSNLTIDLNTIDDLELDPYENILSAEMAAIIAGKPNIAILSQIDLEKAAESYRTQTIIFEVTKKIFNSEKSDWQGNKDKFFIQLIKIVQDFIRSNKIRVKGMDEISELRKKILILVNMNKIVHHITHAVKTTNTQKTTPVFDTNRPFLSTSDMRTWYTTRPNEYTQKSHINYVVLDSQWEGSEAYSLDHDDNVEAWVKNDHLGFEIIYIYGGVVRKYRPDFIIRLKNGINLILEVKGQKSALSDTKHDYLEEWINAVNNHGGFGKWSWDVSYFPLDLPEILIKHSST